MTEVTKILAEAEAGDPNEAEPEFDIYLRCMQPGWKPDCICS